MKISPIAIVSTLSAATLTPLPVAAKGVEFGVLTCHLKDRTNAVLLPQSFQMA